MLLSTCGSNEISCQSFPLFCDNRTFVVVAVCCCSRFLFVFLVLVLFHLFSSGWLATVSPSIPPMSQVAMQHPVAVTTCNLDLENLITDSNRSIATLAITTLLKVQTASSACLVSSIWFFYLFFLLSLCKVLLVLLWQHFVLFWDIFGDCRLAVRAT